MIKDNDILLVNPTGGWKQKTEGTYFFPIGLLYLNNYLLKNNITSTIIDVLPSGLTPERFKAEITKNPPRVIGFTASPWERHIVVNDFIRGLKKTVPNALVVVGGPFFTATHRECLKFVDDVDVVVRGEGEVTFFELVKAISAKRHFKDIDGITYRNDTGEIVINKDRKPSNRDDMEVDPSLLPDENVYSPFVLLKNYEKENVKALPVLLARGCTQKCTFCFNNNNGRYRSRSIESVIREIKYKRQRFNCDHFWMVDPMFTLKKRFATELCNELIKECPGIKWYCETRADCDLSLLKLMADAGCISIDFALESGSPKVLKAIRKELDLLIVLPFARKCKELGIRALVFVMYSLPEETIDDFNKTMDILKTIAPFIYDVSISKTLLLPGTQMEQQAYQEKILPADFNWFDQNIPHVPGWRTLLSEKEIKKCGQQLKDFKTLLTAGKISLYIQRSKRMLFDLGENEYTINFFKAHPMIKKYTKRILFQND